MGRCPTRVGRNLGAPVAIVGAAAIGGLVALGILWRAPEVRQLR